MTILKIKDFNNQEMECYENSNSMFYISIISGDDQDRHRDQFIVLDPLDAEKLVEELGKYIEKNG